MRKRTSKFLKVSLAAIAIILLLGFVVPEHAIIPVKDATRHDWNPETYWYEPWGMSGVHKGIDIFAPSGKPVVAPVHGIVIFRGSLGIGGNAVALLGPKWRIHYFAHLRESHVDALSIAPRGKILGAVGTSGNAAGKPAHLHYSVLSLLPRPWKMSTATQGWKQMFFIDPNEVIGES